MINLKAEIARGLDYQEHSIANEPLVDIMENCFGNNFRYWLDSTTFIPENRISDIREFAFRASRCPGWSDYYFSDFFPSIESLINEGQFNLEQALDIYACYATESSDDGYKAEIYFDIIEFTGIKIGDIEYAIKWIKVAIEDLGELDWSHTNISPSDIFPNYQFEHILNMPDLGQALLSSGRIKDALEIWSKLDEKDIKSVAECMLHGILEYAERNMENDLDYLVHEYNLKRQNKHCTP